MSHFAKVENGIVTEVIVAEQDFINSGAVGDSFLWIQTSYNNNFRESYALIGSSWDGERFIPPKPFESWIFNEETYLWECPVTHPDDGEKYEWNEEDQQWDLVTE